ncbi:unnamed protein product [Rotaria sp. Silwood2]|nr:unnamed protein product [Rotaria sp. Silwood2]CAF4435257.1 unnamed protein product [Rotaria sp. Silwood2]
MSAATANIDNEQNDEEKKEPKEPKINTEQNQKPYEDKLIIHYTHEKRLHDVKRDMHQVYENVFQITPVSDVKLIVGNRNRRNACKELISKRPKLSILTNKSTTKRPKPQSTASKNNVSTNYANPIQSSLYEL